MSKNTVFNTEAFVDTLAAQLYQAACQKAAEMAASAAIPAAASASVSVTAPTAVEGTRKRGRPKGVVVQTRSPEEIQALQEKILTFMADGRVGAEELAVSLQVAPKDLQLPIRKLVESGVLEKEGEKRATKYFVAQKKPVRKPRKAVVVPAVSEEVQSNS